MRDDGGSTSRESQAAPYAVESVVNATRILLMLRQADHLSVAQVAEELGVARSTAHRLMTTLQSQGLLHQAAARQAYTPGPALVELGASVIGAVGLQQRVRPVLDRLSEQVGETSHLLVLLGDEVLFVDGVEGRYAIRAANRVGARELAHTSAAGKVLLAGLSTEELRRRYPKTRLSGGTDQALKTRADLEAELQVTRARGYGLNVSESEDDLCAVSVALDGGAGAVSVSGPASRMSKNIEDVAQRIREALSTLL